jgi:hypothetical protein
MSAAERAAVRVWNTRLVATTDALADVWNSYRDRFPSLPEAEFQVTTSTRASGCGNLDWRASRITLILNPKLVAGSIESLLEWELHEMAHALSKPSPEQSKKRWHSEAFKAAAESLGLRIGEHDEHQGWRHTSLPPDLALLIAVMRLARGRGDI